MSDALDDEGVIDKAEPTELRVSTLELFFDLVFVFTLTQLTGFIEHHLTVDGVIQTMLIFGVLFWMYGGYAWLTNQLPPTVAPRRLLLIGGMGGFFVCALAIPDAFATGGLYFGIGYLAVVVVHTGLYTYGYGRNVWRFAPLNVIGAVCVIAAAQAGGPVKYALWVAPLVLQLVSARLSSRVEEATGAGFDIRPTHFVERHGLLLLIAFGESVIAIGIGLGGVPLTLDGLGAAVLALAVVAALWWSYFTDDHERSEAALRVAPLRSRLRMALSAFFYSFIPMLLGIVTLAAGLGLAIGDIGGRLEVAESLLLGGGVALFLAGSVGFRLSLGIQPIASRLLAAGAALATVLLGVGMSALSQVVAILGLLIVLLIGEGFGRQRAKRSGDPAA